MSALLRNGRRANDESTNLLVIDQLMHVLTTLCGLAFKHTADLEDTYAIALIKDSTSNEQLRLLLSLNHYIKPPYGPSEKTGGPQFCAGYTDDGRYNHGLLAEGIRWRSRVFLQVSQSRTPFPCCANGSVQV